MQLRTRRLPYDARAARRHLLRADPVMRAIVKDVGPFTIEVRGRPYQSLMRALLYQQLAAAAAAAIERRFLALYGGRTPEPNELLSTKAEDLRAAGLSRQKASYLMSLAEHFSDGLLNDRKLLRMDDQAIVEAACQVKGVGPWTADMLLLFCIGRPDVLPVGDLGVRASMMKAYGLEALPDPATMERIAEPWRPYRSAGSWYLWRRVDTLTL
jgi:3-methyladenine DNA glycosylase/8-oxoguanine DNA glycosylase